ncbi:LysR family transcriptional regulator [Pseudomonas sp. SWI6]|uniref:LysR family transcriptional regulator n=1 Tax=Pseudomonas taiwanensis TaxID=470150 RepID=A0ABR6VE49_9PSED|nr:MULTISPECIES: LysR substrate-binding domain-containing protein [Pseudomonas]AGZ35048.1 LysR family transcriptional regulator [Pseudomonas sp. VLB120]AVD83467.1 LysR family transcriptional regulator [Pseudomonas sp. SWI6]AVD90661.1 LysR family transcriptional regulator [Pseudomonas sp. SWI44]MBC3478813.1 LysR family transcriptional regulator [Pseudomonas taiwanensis]MBC3493917.1 LysR family transcriptional regulator [Pseudomonas taiwanensis]
MPEGFPNLPSLNALRVFEVVARHLNFRLAAEELGVTQAAVAQQIRGLEASLEIRLFERLPRGLGMTDAGRSYASRVRSALSMIDEATRLLRPQPLHLTVSVTPSFASKWLIPRLGAFAEDYPDIDLRVLATDKLSHFSTDSVDLAVRYGQPPFGPGLNTELLMDQRIVAVASPRLLASKGAPDSFEALQDFVMLHDAHDFWPEFTGALFAQHAQGTAKNVRFNQTSLAIEAAINGQGIALASQMFVQGDIDAGRLEQVFAQQLRLDKAFYLVWPRKAGTPPGLAVVKDWLLRQAHL